MPNRTVNRAERRTLALLGLPTFALALSVTMVTSYLPVVARQFTPSTIVIGIIIGGEGLLATFVPLVAGSWSDSLDTRIGGRLPFVLAGAPLLATALLLMGVVASLASLAAVVAL